MPDLHNFVIAPSWSRRRCSDPWKLRNAEAKIGQAEHCRGEAAQHRAEQVPFEALLWGSSLLPVNVLVLPEASDERRIEEPAMKARALLPTSTTKISSLISSSPEVVSQNNTEQSSDPEARRPSGNNARVLTQPMWPWRVELQFPLCRSHSLIVLTKELEASRPSIGHHRQIGHWGFVPLKAGNTRAV